jgi:hypothetical protein
MQKLSTSSGLKRPRFCLRIDKGLCICRSHLRQIDPAEYWFNGLITLDIILLVSILCTEQYRSRFQLSRKILTTVCRYRILFCATGLISLQGIRGVYADLSHHAAEDG